MRGRHNSGFATYQACKISLGARRSPKNRPYGSVVVYRQPDARFPPLWLYNWATADEPLPHDAEIIDQIFIVG